MGISVKDGAAIHDLVSFEILQKVCVSHYPAFWRSAFRNWGSLDNRNNYIGLRLARTLLTP